VGLGFDDVVDRQQPAFKVGCVCGLIWWVFFVKWLAAPPQLRPPGGGGPGPGPSPAWPQPGPGGVGQPQPGPGLPWPQPAPGGAGPGPAWPGGNVPGLPRVGLFP
jgi:hypothetical protein